MRGLSIEIDAEQIGEIAAEVGAAEKHLAAAMRSTYGRMGKWLRTRAVRGLSAELRIQQKILRRRFRAFRLSGGVGSRGAGAKVWFGLSPIPFADLRPRKTDRGVRAAGGRSSEGAFIVTKRGKIRVLKRDGAARLPLHTVVADIAEPAQVYIEDELVGTADFEEQFFKTLRRELSWRTKFLG